MRASLQRTFRVLTLAVASLSANAVASAGPTNAVSVPAWLYPLVPSVAAATVVYDTKKRLHVPGSKVTFTEAQLNDLFSVPDWQPQSHAVMPEIVAHGRAPEVYACGYCHTAGGQGRPENASLAGLPAPYIIQQVVDFKSGARRSAWPGPYRPADGMIHAATYATNQEVAEAARYFSQQRLQSHVRVVDTARVPRSRVVGWVYAAMPGKGDEPLGERLLEFAPSATRHENRDDNMEYVAYVPLGSINRGEILATTGGNGLTLPCTACHGNQLQGMALVPRLAGRSPTYLLRQLLAFKTGARAGEAGVLMRPVVAKLEISHMIDLAAYSGSLAP